MNTMSNELILDRLIDASPENVYRCWTEPALLKQWFSPTPVKTVTAEVDLRVGGRNLIEMQLPDGTKISAPGTYLEIVPNRKLVFTDAYVGDWLPKPGKPFMTAILTFANEDGKTRYIARVRHWSSEDYDTHVQMGFHTVWGQWRRPACGTRQVAVNEKVAWPALRVHRERRQIFPRHPREECHRDPRQVPRRPGNRRARRGR